MDRSDRRFWKGGVFYYNPEDAALWVDKRAGIGWTVNFANRSVWAVMALLLLIPLGVIGTLVLLVPAK